MGVLLGPRPLAAFEERAALGEALGPGGAREAPGGGALAGVSWVNLSACSQTAKWAGGFLSVA